MNIFLRCKKTIDQTGLLPFRIIAMKPRLVVLLLCASLVSAVCARAKTNLPDACGDDNIKFDVKTEKSKTPPAPPAAGKAQIVLIENENFAFAPFMHITVRFGMDGAWVGADNGNSYFALTVDPGVHHLCANWQSVLGAYKKDVDLTSFIAEAGKIYYFEASIGATKDSTGSLIYEGDTTAGQWVNIGGSPGMPIIGFVQLDEDTGKYRVKAWKLATWKTNK